MLKNHLLWIPVVLASYSSKTNNTPPRYNTDSSVKNTKMCKKAWFKIVLAYKHSIM